MRIDFRIEWTHHALRSLSELPPRDRQLAERRMAEIAELSAILSAPRCELLQEAGFGPPLLRTRAGLGLLFYEVDPERWAVRVKHVARMPPPEEPAQAYRAS